MLVSLVFTDIFFECGSYGPYGPFCCFGKKLVWCQIVHRIPACWGRTHFSRCLWEGSNFIRVVFLTLAPILFSRPLFRPLFCPLEKCKGVECIQSVIRYHLQNVNGTWVLVADCCACFNFILHRWQPLSMVASGPYATVREVLYVAFVPQKVHGPIHEHSPLFVNLAEFEQTPELLISIHLEIANSGAPEPRII